MPDKARINRAKEYFEQHCGGWDSCYIVYFSDEDAFKLRRQIPAVMVNAIIVSEYYRGKWHDTDAGKIFLPIFGK